MARFPLETVLRVREIRERMARTGVARARTAEADAHRALVDGKRTLAEHTSPAIADPQSFTAAFLARQSLADQVHALHGLAATRAAERQAAVDQWQQHEQDRAAVDKLRERHDAERTAADLAGAQAEIDDVAGRPRRPLGGQA